MTDIAVVTVSSFLAQALLAALLAILLLRFHSSRKHAFLRHWALSWFALCAGQLGAMVAFHLAASAPASTPARLAATFVAQLGAYFQAGWLILGATELASGRSPSRRSTRAIFSSLAGLALVSTLAYAFTPEAFASRNFLRVSVRALVVAAAFLLAAGVLLRAYRKSTATGPHLVCIAFFLYGIEQLVLFWTTAGPAGNGLRFGIVPFDLLMVAVLGIATVVWLLEDEHFRLVEASLQIEKLAYYDGLTGLPMPLSSSAERSESVKGPSQVAADTRLPPPAPSRRVKGPSGRRPAGGHVASITSARRSGVIRTSASA